MKYASFLIALMFCCAACKQAGKPPAMGFYYWRTQFELSPTEQAALLQQSTVLYTRYFDVDVQPGDSIAKPIAPIHLTSHCKAYPIVPVVFIKNRVFEKTDSVAIRQLARNVHELIAEICEPQHLKFTQVQFDCDWTIRTRQWYFYFLTCYRQISNYTLSATIRLHQVKYRQQTGVPPVDNGVLMYYNMGTIDASHRSSIYEPGIAAQYNGFISGYPLPLNLALPIFRWGIQVRDGKVVQLLNKINSNHFAADTNFMAAGPQRLLVKQAGFKAGYYFQAGDEVKLEQVSQPQLLQMAAQLNSRIKPQQIIFYDLDSINLSFYDKTIFKKVLAEFR